MAVFEKNSRPLPTVRDDALDLRKVALVSRLRSSSIKKKHWAATFVTVEEVKFLKKIVWICGACQRLKEQWTEGEDERFSWSVAVSIYWYGAGAAFSAKRAPEVQNRRYAILEGSGTIAKAPGKVFESPDYPDTLSETSFEEFLRLLHLTFESEQALKEKTDWTVWNPVISVSDEGRDRKERDAGRARYISRREPLMGLLKNDGDRV